MLARVFSATLFGLRPQKIEVEIETHRGVPRLIIIGLPNKAVNEAKERIVSALSYCGVKIRRQKTIINLAPADVPKTTSTLELAIAVGLLRQYGLIKQPLDETLFLGELSLDGKIKPVRGILPLALAASKMGFKRIVFPFSNIQEVETLREIALFPIVSLQEYLAHGKGEKKLLPLQPKKFTSQICKKIEKNSPGEQDFKDILGQNFAKRALEISVAGKHSIFLSGPPGVGKSMLAQAVPSILPALTEEESLEVSKVYSVSRVGLQRMLSSPPFRSPHHSISRSGLIGGGRFVAPGEISLAHHGVLFLDEVMEFEKASLEALRQPLEEKTVSLVQTFGKIQYPASCLFIAAANPCPCGYFQSSTRVCDCNPGKIQLYQKKLSGPILDRIDLFVRVADVKIRQMQDYKKNENIENSTTIQKRVVAARMRQEKRQGKHVLNGELSLDQIKQFCFLDKIAQSTLNQAAENLSFSARGYFKTIKVAQTIADLDKSEVISQGQILEALGYRSFSPH